MHVFTGGWDDARWRVYVKSRITFFSILLPLPSRKNSTVNLSWERYIWFFLWFTRLFKYSRLVYITLRGLFPYPVEDLEREVWVSSSFFIFSSQECRESSPHEFSAKVGSPDATAQRILDDNFPGAEGKIFLESSVVLFFSNEGSKTRRARGQRRRFKLFLRRTQQQ